MRGLRPAAAAAALVAVVAVPRPAAATDAASLSRVPVRPSDAWRSYVLDSPTPLVYPERVLVRRRRGGVVNPNGLRAPGGGATTILGRARLVLDLGRDTGGTVEVGITRSDGTPVRLAYSESRAALTPTGDYEGNSLGSDDANGRFDVVARRGRWRSAGVRGAQRWILLQLERPGAVTIDYVRVRVAHYRPRPADYAGRFLSSDRLLNRVWYGSVYTFNLDSVRHGGNTVLIDGGKRDRWIWIGDLAVADRVGYYSTPRATRIVRDSLDAFTCQQFPDGYLPAFSEVDVRCAPGKQVESPLGGAVPLGSYTAWWVVALANYYLYSGDAAFVRERLPVVRRALAWLASRSPSGLYSAGLPNEINWHPFDTATGEDAHTNAVYWQALRSAAQLERRFGSPALAAADEARASGLRSLLITRLWDRTAGALRVNTEDPSAHGQDGNAYAAAVRLLDYRRAGRALGFIRRRLWTRHGPLMVDRRDDPYMARYISPYMSAWELQARFARGQTATALDLIRRVYGWMADRDPGGVMWEKMTPRGTPQPYADAPAGQTSLAHAWSAGAAPALSEWVLGLRPLAPGWSQWAVTPQTSGLGFAQGQVRTPRGIVVSRWRRDRRGFRITAGGPGVGVVSVPLYGKPRTIAMDGRVVWRGRQAKGNVGFAGVRGVHTFAWSAE